ncbi:hypothetical protein [Novosphingobium mangrovi (ex Huang et al. 2023)]|uniref:Uncharacterized protein n=1 Tax=Novosphingobium mangrovi (ex Huang et al. 2023) TaxID=2976432 RepID=A0ABT2I6C0_9SPHN|nr:hypothetical protein [Novosphingobium mangrovi (ex Huang et al. 2023)]MCT2400360.1 hypothetical protein [Novosphingobium mangrovi (ex Huang et al. 2023)]
MVRNLHIERQKADGEPSAITLEEWTEAVDHVEGVRMANGDAHASNPRNEHIVVLPNRGGDAEVFREDCERWLRALFWTPDGTVRFAEPEMKDDPVLTLARSLAGELGAHVYDDKGKACG